MQKKNLMLRVIERKISKTKEFTDGKPRRTIHTRMIVENFFYK